MTEQITSIPVFDSEVAPQDRERAINQARGETTNEVEIRNRAAEAAAEHQPRSIEERIREQSAAAAAEEARRREREAMHVAIESGAIGDLVENDIRAQQQREIDAAAEQRPSPETPISEEEARRTIERTKKFPKWAKYVIIILLTVGPLAYGIVRSIASSSPENPAIEQPSNTPATPEDINTIVEPSAPGEAEATYNQLTGYEEFDSRIDGSFEQYDNPGCYDDKDGKYSPTSVANVESALNLIGKTMETATPEELGAALEYVTYSQKESAAFTAISHNLSITDDDGNTINFGELSYEEACEVIAGMSDTEKANLQKELHDTFEHTTYDTSEVNGSSTNYYIEEKDGEKHGMVSTIDANCIPILVQTVTHEDGSKTIATFMVRCFNGDQIVIVVNENGTEREVTIRLTPTDPTPPTPTPPTPTPEPKDSENLTRIDQNANEDIAEDIGTEEVRVTPTQPSQVESQPVTPKPTSESYQGTSATTTTNTSTTTAEPVQPATPSNNYGQDQGRANPLPSNAVAEDTTAQTTANANERTPDNTLHADDAGSLSVDDLLNQP